MKMHARVFFLLFFCLWGRRERGNDGAIIFTGPCVPPLRQVLIEARLLALEAPFVVVARDHSGLGLPR